MVKNPAANVADMGSVLGLGRSHVLMEQLSPRATTRELICCNKRFWSHNYNLTATLKKKKKKSICVYHWVNRSREEAVF